MEQYKLRYDGGRHIGSTPNYDQAMSAARGLAKSTGLSVLVADIDGNDVREIVVHPDGSITHLWNSEK